MVVNQSTEQAVVALLMLACQKGHMPLTAQQMAAAMDVSESYLKKTMRKLVVGGLVMSIRSRDGGFTLARSIEQITLGDVFRAMEGGTVELAQSSLAEGVFSDCARLPVGEETVRSVLQEAGEAFFSVLDRCVLSSLLQEEARKSGNRNWPEIARQSLQEEDNAAK